MTNPLDHPIPTGAYINGAFRPAASGATFPVRDPATTDLIVEVADGGESDARAALDAASAAQPEFARLSPRARSEMLRRAFELMTARAEELARLIVSENGKTLSDARGEVAYAAEYFRWFSEEAVRNRGMVMTAPSGANRILVEHQPLGVCVLITPWNFPAAMLTRKIGPALAAGCTVVCKPAEDTPLTALVLAQILEESGVPAGVVNVVPTSRPAPFVETLLADRRVRKLSFTGSTEVGRMLLAGAARRIVNCSMELGGNAPFLVFADADLDAAIAGAMIAKMRNGGEACTAANRFYVEEPIAEEFSRRLAAEMSAIRVGSGLDPDVQLGPLVNAEAIEKVAALVGGALDAGARPLVGGAAIDRPGYFYAPTVLEGVAPDAAILSEEIFGPVAPLVTFRAEGEAIELANSTDYGLVSYLYTRDLARGLRVAEQLEAGMIALNRGLVSDPAAPFGGAKESGLGREGGHEGLEEYLEQKYIAVSW